jgi:Skp family chaperone for outer membrane proteins
MKLLLIAVCLIVLSSTEIAAKSQTQTRMERIRIGMPQESVIFLLGEPDSKAPSKGRDDQVVETFKYQVGSIVERYDRQWDAIDSEFKSAIAHDSGQATTTAVVELRFVNRILKETHGFSHGPFAIATLATPRKKILTCELPRLYDESPKTTERNAWLRIEEEKAQAELDVYNAEGKALVAALKKSESTLKRGSPEEKKTAAEKVKELRVKIDEKTSAIEKFKNSRVDGFKKEIGTHRLAEITRIIALVTEYAAENGFEFVYDTGPLFLGFELIPTGIKGTDRMRELRKYIDAH